MKSCVFSSDSSTVSLTRVSAPLQFSLKKYIGLENDTKEGRSQLYFLGPGEGGGKGRKVRGSPVATGGGPEG